MREASEDPVLRDIDPGERVVLVEVVNADQFPGRVNFAYPLLRGHLDRLGIPARWIRFGVATTNLLEHGRDQITLPDADLARLIDVVAGHRPTLVVLTDALAPAQTARVAEAAPGARVYVLDRTPLAAIPLFAAFRGYFELDRPDFSPRYDWEAGNEAALRRDIDNVYVLLKGSCGHRRSVASSPAFAGIDDPRVAGRTGCSFCENWIDVARDVSGTPDAWIDRQLRGIAASRGTTGRYPHAILLERIESRDVLRQCVDALAATGMDAHVRLLFAVRADQVPFLERFLDEHFAANPSSPQQFGTYATGIESLDADDLERFNKGTRPLDGLRAINGFRGLAARHPGRFDYTGITFILLTPWTTAEGLCLNLGLLRALDLHAEAGNLFESRLRLHPALPIACLAERDGLILEEAADPVQVMNRRKLFGNERPWRFADPRIEPFSGVLVRLSLLGSPLADPLGVAIRERLDGAGIAWQDAQGRDLLDLVAGMAEVVRSTPDALDEIALVERTIAARKARRTSAGGRPRPDRFRVGEARTDVPGLAKRLAATLGGERAVATVDGVAADEAVAAGAVLESLGVAHGLAEDTLILARDAGDVARAQALRAVLASSTDAAARQAAVEAYGRLHGVPVCCARAHAAGPFAGVDLPAWAALFARSGEAGGVPVAVNPLLAPSVAFVPCGPRCAAAEAVLRARFEAIGLDADAVAGPGTAALFSLDGPGLGDGGYARLAVAACDETTLAYRVEGPLGGVDEALAATLRAGDCLRLAPGQVRVCAGDRVLDVLTASHGLWSPDRAWYADEWRELARAAAFVAARRAVEAADTARRGASRTGGAASAVRDDRLTDLLRKVAARFDDYFAGVSDLSVARVAGGGVLRMGLAVEGGVFELDLLPAGEGACFLRTERFRVVDRSGNPRLSAADAERVATLARLFDKAVARYAPDVLAPDGGSR